MTTDWSSFVVVHPRYETVAVPTLSAFFYFGHPVHDIAVELADAIERYVGLVGLDVLEAYVADSGYPRAMNKRKLNKDLKLLRNFPPDYVGANADYDVKADATPHEFGLYLRATDLSDSFEARRASLLRLDFPPTWLERQPPDDFIAFFQSIVELPHVQSANAGLAFKRTEATLEKATRLVNAEISRFFGFDPCYDNLRNKLRGRILSAHWLNFIDDELAEELGGAEAIEEALPRCEVRVPTRGVLIRGAKLPPIGDINRQAPDLGCLPDVARVLRPIRAQINAFGEPASVFDGSRWLARLDELPSRPWEGAA